MNIIKTVAFESLGDDRGSLIALEANKNVPFEIKRVYYIFDTKQGVSRGFHAHRDLKQIAVCVTGSCRFVLDNGITKEEITLSKSTIGLVIESMIWREIYDFTPDCVLMVIANQYYSEKDYIRNYQEYLNAIS